LAPCDFSLFSRLKLSWKAAVLTHWRWSRQNRRQYWTPSQNTTSKMHLKNGISAGKGAYVQKGTTSRVMVASRPKVSFWPDGSTNPRNYGYQWYNA
jgi:hypothetical protein